MMEKSETVMQAFLPELMMRPEERAKARRLLRKLVRFGEQSRVDELLPRPERKGYEHFSALRTPVWAEMEDLAAEVWKREVGLERYSVVRVRNDDVEYHLQVLSFSFYDGRPCQERWMWKLNGRGLRKDGTLGSKHTHVGVRFDEVHRRHLDGIWRPLLWRSGELA